MRSRLLVANVLAAVLTAGAAQAADMAAPVVTKAPVVAPAFSWTGFYIGAHAGYGWGRTEFSHAYQPEFPDAYGDDIADAEYDTDGWLAGGQIGFNYQIDQFVIGVEADASWADINGSGEYFVYDPQDVLVGTCVKQGDPCRSEIDALGTITARLGVAFDRALFYVKGGAAWASVSHRSGYTDADPEFSWHDTVDETRWGWTIGGGAEYAFADNWSVKVEYNYIDLGDDKVTFNYQPDDYVFPHRATVDQHLHIVKAGINYRF